MCCSISIHYLLYISEMTSYQQIASKSKNVNIINFIKVLILSIKQILNPLQKATFEEVLKISIFTQEALSHKKLLIFGQILGNIQHNHDLRSYFSYESFFKIIVKCCKNQIHYISNFVQDQLSKNNFKIWKEILIFLKKDSVL